MAASPAATRTDAGAEALGLYLHIPFCEAKCSYCHFAIDPRRPDAAREEHYLRALNVLEVRSFQRPVEPLEPCPPPSVSR